MLGPSKKIKTDSGSIASLYGDGQQQRNKRKIAKQPAKNLLDLNEDCLFEIFERADVMDLANVAKSCQFLKTIAFDIFKRKYKTLNLKYSGIVSVKEAAKAKQLFRTFGSSIVELDIKFQPWRIEADCRAAAIVHAIVTECTSLKTLKIDSFVVPDDEFWFMRIRKLFARLETLDVAQLFFESEDYWPNEYVTTPNGNSINSFDNCTSLRELKLYESYFFYDVLFQNYFPKLQHLIIEDPESCISNGMNAFILRHPHLKTFSLSREHSHLPIAAANLRSLETFGFQFEDEYPPGSPTKTSYESLAKFQNLKELICFDVGREDNMSRLLNILPKLANTLEVLDLQYGCGNRDFVSVVNSLPKLKVVRLTDISIKDTPDDDLKDLIRATVIFE